MEKEVKSDKTASEQLKRNSSISNQEYNEELRLRLGERNRGEVISYENLKEIAPEFSLWIKDIVRYGNVDSQVLMFRTEKGFTCLLHTNEHCYSISGYTPSRNSNGYLGCTVTTRKKRVGEDWNRGNDLPDGKYDKRTFDKIVRSMVAYEIKNLQLWR